MGDEPSMDRLAGRGMRPAFSPLSFCHVNDSRAVLFHVLGCTTDIQGGSHAILHTN